MKTKALQILPAYTRTPIGATQTTIPLREFKDTRGNTITTMPTDVEILYGTLERTSSNNQEIISFTGITDDGDGQVTLTGVTRNLDPQDAGAPLTATVAHSNGVELIVSNNPQFLQSFASRYNDQTIDGQYTFTAGNRPRVDTDADTATSEAFVTYGQLLRTALGGTFFISGIVVEGTAGENLTLLDAVYLNETDGKWYKAKANDTSTYTGKKLGIVKTSTNADNTIAEGVLIDGYIDGFTGLSIGKVYISDTGAISSTAGTNTVAIGRATSATEVLFDGVDELTTDQKEAMDTTTPPSSTNKFLTENSISSYSDGVELDIGQSNTSLAFGLTDGAGKNNKIAQTFLASDTGLTGIVIQKKANTGSPTSDVIWNIYAVDADGYPTGASIENGTITNAEWLGYTDDGEVNLTITPANYTKGTKYALELTTSIPSDTNYMNVGLYSTSDNYIYGKASKNNTADGWVDVNYNLYFKINEDKIDKYLKTKDDGSIDINLIPPQKLFQAGYVYPYSNNANRYTTYLSPNKKWMVISVMRGSDGNARHIAVFERVNGFLVNRKTFNTYDVSVSLEYEEKKVMIDNNGEIIYIVKESSPNTNCRIYKIPKTTWEGVVMSQQLLLNTMTEQIQITGTNSSRVSKNEYQNRNTVHLGNDKFLYIGTWDEFGTLSENTTGLSYGTEIDDHAVCFLGDDYYVRAKLYGDDAVYDFNHTLLAEIATSSLSNTLDQLEVFVLTHGTNNQAGMSNHQLMYYDKETDSGLAFVSSYNPYQTSAGGMVWELIAVGGQRI